MLGLGCDTEETMAFTFLLLLSLLLPLNRAFSSSSSGGVLPDQISTSTLHWIHSRLSLNNNDTSQLTAIVTGHPPILSYDIEKRLEPVITFYEDALRGYCAEDTYDDDTKDDVSSNCNITTDSDVRDRLISLLCKSPQLLEYNVKKRLAPRLERVHISLGKQIHVDEDILKIIATKTDSRFDEWLYNSSSDRRNNTIVYDTRRQYNNSNIQMIKIDNPIHI